MGNIPPKKRRVIVLSGRSTFKSPIYRSWTEQIDQPLDYIQDYGPLWEPPDDTGLVVTHRHYHAPETSLLPHLVETGIPVLVLADGILEYRNIWQNPAIKPTAVFQPVLGHKIAVIGNSQARVISSWGNSGKCEVVGLPRMDHLPLIAASAPPQKKKLSILVCTARTPGFTENQRDLIIQSLIDLRKWFEDRKVINDHEFEVHWRLTKDLSKTVGVAGDVSDITGKEMAEALADSDILITTPSTTMLEGMRFGLPTVLLDYTNSPAYVPAAWSITAPSHIENVITEVVAADPAKCKFQDAILHDALECRTPAIPRLINLMESMIEIACDCQQKSKPIAFPEHILPPTEAQIMTPQPEPQTDAPLKTDQLLNERDNLVLLAEEQQKKIKTLENKIHEMKSVKFRTLFAKAVKEQLSKISRKAP